MEARPKAPNSEQEYDMIESRILECVPLYSLDTYFLGRKVVTRKLVRDAAATLAIAV